MKHQQRVGIHYVWSDRIVATALSRAVEDLGFETTLSLERKGERQAFTSAIAQSAQTNATIFVVISRDYLEAPFSRSEWLACSLSQSRVIPVVVDDLPYEDFVATSIPLLLRSVPIDRYRELIGRALKREGHVPAQPTSGGSLVESIRSYREARRVSTEHRRLSNIPMPRDIEIPGREELLRDVRVVFEDLRKGPSPAVQALVGDWGKTSLAAAYANVHEDDFDVAWWLNGDSRSSILQGYMALAKELDIAEPGDSRRDGFERLQAWSSKSKKRWLMVLDNVERVDDIVDLIPRRGDGEILITTRDPKIRATLPHVDVGVLGLESASSYLLERSYRREGAAARQIARAVAGRTFALRQAAAWVRERDESLSEYWSVLESATKSVPVWERGERRYLVASVTIALQQMEKASPPEFIDVLIVAALAPDGIRVSDLTSFTVDDQSFVSEVVRSGVRFAVGTLSDSLRFRVFPDVADHLVSSANRARVEKNLRRLLKHFAARFPGVESPSSDLEASAEWLNMLVRASELAERFDVKGLAAARVAHRLGQWMVLRGEHEQAVTFFKLSLRRLEGVSGTSALSLRRMVMNDVAVSLAGAGFDEQAILWFRQLFPGEVDVGQADDPQSATLLINWASSLADSGSLTQARELLTSVMSSPLVDDPILHAGALHALGTVCSELSDIEGARMHLKDAVELRLMSLGERHPHTIRSEVALLKVLPVDEQSVDRALHWVETARSSLGAESPVTIECLETLVAMLHERHDHQGVVRFGRLAIEARGASGSAVGSSFAECAFTVAQSLSELGAVQEASLLVDAVLERGSESWFASGNRRQEIKQLQERLASRAAGSIEPLDLAGTLAAGPVVTPVRPAMEEQRADTSF